MFSKPEGKPEPPKVYIVMTEDGAIAGAYLDPAAAEYAAGEANAEHQPEFEPFFVNDVEIKASPSDWRAHCHVCQAREAFYKKTEDDLK